MTLHVREATPGDRAAWDAFVASRTEGDPLQAWPWGVANEAFGERPLRVMARDDDGRVRAVAQVLARHAAGGRQVLYVPHGPVWERDARDARAVLGAMIEELGRVGRRERGIVLKLDPRADGVDAAGLRSELEGYGLRPARHDLQAPTTRVVDLLDGAERLMATWHADARRLSRRAERERVVVEVDRLAAHAAVAAFHELLVATAERADFRTRSLAFLEGAAREFSAASGWYTVLARFDGRRIAGMALPRVGNRAYYLYGASLREPELRHKYGAYAAMAAAMGALAADGVESVDMWGVVEPDDRSADPRWEGFSAFKRTFGGRPLRHPGTFDLVLDPFWYRLRDAREQLRDLISPES